MFRTPITALVLTLAAVSALPVTASADTVMVFTATTEEGRQQVERDVRHHANRYGNMGTRRDEAGLWGGAAGGRNTGVVAQSGKGNGAAIRQGGQDNLALIVQQGRGHTATANQQGRRNTLGVFQRGQAGSAVDLAQAGYGNATLVIIEGTCTGPQDYCAIER